ncbi:metallopeptidase [Haloferula sp.]|uniref:metallopeptidase n=1 Tax=Haloferula sp. TaxID=2497595 RepID=UPI00329CCB64
MSPPYLIIIASLLAGSLLSAQESAPVPAKPNAHELHKIEGWEVHVDRRLLEGSEKDLGSRALKLIEGRLHEIVVILPADKVKRLQQVPIWIDLSHGELKSMQYHPSKSWLKKNGYDPALAKGFHIPDASRFASAKHHHTQPWATLHELAHAYHDQVLGFDQKEVHQAWVKFCESKKYEEVRHISGRMRPHYALTNQKEFFSEMTEAYFGMNDFYPYHRDDLRMAEPEIFDLMKSIWGPLP